MKLCYKLIVVVIVFMMVFLAGCTNDEKAMVEAVKKGDTATVQSLLEKGVSPNLKTDDAKSILMLAAYLGHTDIARLLIEKGADVNAKDNGGKTALIYTAQTDNIEMAKLLLENGADLNAIDNNGKTALQTAQDSNQTEMAEFLSNWGKQTPVPTPTEAPVPTPTPTAPAPTPTLANAPVSTPIVNANQQLPSIFFDYDKSTIRSDQVATLNNILATVKEHPDLYVILGGHADDRGPREYNRGLSERRAGAIQRYLTYNGIDPKRVIIYGFGKDHPSKKGEDEGSRSYNRRVDILLWESILSEEQVLAETLE